MSVADTKSSSFSGGCEEVHTPLNPQDVDVCRYDYFVNGMFIQSARICINDVDF